MRIARNMNAELSIRQASDALNALIIQPTAQQERPCQGCQVACNTCRHDGCTCMCTYRCSRAPQQLSSDGERFPIEAGIMPLVFELAALRVFHPNWSCEGHEKDGTVTRLPRVWFEPDHPLYANLLMEHLVWLQQQHLIDYVWRVSLVVNDVRRLAFSIEPDLSLGDTVSLLRLRKDIRSIADHLRENARPEAKRTLQELLEESRRHGKGTSPA